LAELTAELFAIAEAVGVQVLTESVIQAMAAEAVERIEREFASTGGRCLRWWSSSR
jgi:hypothetical protein